MRLSTAVLVVGGVAGLCLAGCKRLDKAPGGRPPVAAALDRTVLLATVTAPVARPPAPPPSRLGLHAMEPDPSPDFVFSARGGGVAWVAEQGEALQVVHNGRPGKAYRAVGPIALSPDGQRCAHGALVDGRWRMVVDGVEGAPYSAVRLPGFSPDGKHLAYQAMEGERWLLVVDATVGPATETRFLAHQFSGDSTRIAYLADASDDEWGRLAISDLAFRAPVAVDGRVSRMVLDERGTRLAAVGGAKGRVQVLTLSFGEPGRVERGAVYDAVDELAFGPGDAPLAYLAERAGSRLVVLGAKEEVVPPGDMLVGPLVVRPDGKVVGALVVSAGAVHLRQFLAADRSDQGAYDEADGLVYSWGGRSVAFAARRGARWRIVVDGREGPDYDRVVTPSFSPDGKYVAYRARQDGRRFVVVADRRGRTVREHPAHEQVFPILYTADGQAAAYGVKDGSQLSWIVEAL